MTRTASPTLLADIGGTNIRFALATPDSASPLDLGSMRRYRVADLDSLTTAVRRYLADLPVDAAVDRGVFVAAGRVEGEEVRITNHPWRITVAAIKADLGFRDVRLVNDFAGLSLCLPLLGAGDTEIVGSAPAPVIGAADTQTYAVIGPGTGLGVGAFLVRDGRPEVLETEGGHTSFAPCTEEEADVLRILWQRYGRVSNERLLCGSGLVNLYQALCVRAGATPAPHTPERITELAHAGDPLCLRTVDVFCAALGTVASDLVLAFGAWDGVYLCGGLLPTLLPFLHRGGFRARFEDKGRFADAMPRVPIVAIRHPEPGLLGAAAMALLASGRPLLKGASAPR